MTTLIPITKLGTVRSVNDVDPDDEGNVVIALPGAPAADDITDATATGIAVITAATQAAARAAIGAGTSSVAIGTGSGKAPDDTAVAHLTGAETVAGVKTFSSSPVIPTPTAGDNTTKAASTAYVVAAITALIGGAPGALDTLKELADAIGDDASYAASIATALGLKAPLISPALTGSPTAPTPAGGDNDTSIATTAFVQGELVSILSRISVLETKVGGLQIIKATSATVWGTWDGTGWTGTVNTSAALVRIYLSLDTVMTTIPTFYNADDEWFANPSQP